MGDKLGGCVILLNKNKWLIKNKPFLSIRRFLSLIFLLSKRALGLDVSFNPPLKGKYEEIDVFMPTIEKDLEMLELSVMSIRKYSLNPIKDIYIVGPKKSKKIKELSDRLSCKFINEEDVLSFKKEDINYFYKGYSRNGWVYKMLLNLYSDEVCKSKNILILDSDTIFIYPQLFIYKGRPIFNLSDEFHAPYYIANERILGIKHKSSRSFITHYMLFDRTALKKMRKYIENKHHDKWYSVIIDNIYRRSGSGFADYEIYGDFYTQLFKKPYIINYWSNVSHTISSKKDLDLIINRSKDRFRSVSLHHYKENF